MTLRVQFLMSGSRRRYWSLGYAMVVFLLLFVICAACSQGDAQVLYGSLTGNVSDPSNAPVPGAKVVAVNAGTGIAKQGVTDVRGVYLKSGGLTWSWTPMLSRNYAPAGYDRAHNFQFYGVFAAPFGHNQRWVSYGLGAAILGGWTFSPILSRESGLPFTVTSSGASLNAPGNSQTADQVLSHVAILGGHGPGEPYFDPNAFAPVKAVRFGTSGRNFLRGPGFFDLDASLVRSFAIKERFNLEFRAEAYGLTNTPQFANPAANVSSASFGNGTLTRLNGYDIISSATGNRQIRFALKLSF